MKLNRRAARRAGIEKRVDQARLVWYRLKGFFRDGNVASGAAELEVIFFCGLGGLSHARHENHPERDAAIGNSDSEVAEEGQGFGEAFDLAADKSFVVDRSIDCQEAVDAFGIGAIGLEIIGQGVALGRIEGLGLKGRRRLLVLHEIDQRFHIAFLNERGTHATIFRGHGSAPPFSLRFSAKFC